MPHVALSLLSAASVEEILSYRIKCRFITMVPSKSLRILQELSSSCTEAQHVYTECCRPSSQSKDDYAIVRDSFSVDKKILWIRMAILEGKLAAILEKLVTNSRYVPVHVIVGVLLCLEA